MPKPNRILYRYQDQSITREDIVQKLRLSGIEPGDTIMVHSDTGTIGKLGDVSSRNDFYNELLLAFQTAIGPNGTLVVPTYTYSFCKNKPFNLLKTPSVVGSFTEFIRIHPDAYRSSDPIFSHAAIGLHAKKLLSDVSNDTFGDDSFFDRFFHTDGKLINFGNEFDITFLHYIEYHAGVEYRYNKTFEGEIIHPSGKTEHRKVNYYVRALPEDGYNVEYDMTLLGNELGKRDLLKRVELGASQILTTSIRDCFYIGLEMLEQNPFAFLTKPPGLQILKK